MMLTSDCHRLPEHSVLAWVRRAQQSNDLDVEHIVSLHGHLNKRFNDDPCLRFVLPYYQDVSCVFFKRNCATSIAYYYKYHTC